MSAQKDDVVRQEAKEKEAINNLSQDRNLVLCKLLIFLAAVAINTAITGTAIGGTYYVDSTKGSDSNPGTSQSPWKSISWAESEAENGSTVYLLPGNYGDVSISGAENNGRSSWADAVVFTNVPGQARPEFKRLSISGNVDHYIVFDHIYVNCPYGNGVTVPVYIPNGGYVKISNCEIKGTIGVHSSCGKLCEQVSTNYILQFGQEGNTGVRDLILENSHCHTSRTGVRLEGDSYGGIVFRGNHVHDFGGSMFKLKGDTHGQTLYVENNNMHTQLAMWRHDDKFPAGGEYVHGSGLSLRCENVTARNNIIRACAASTQITTYRYIFPEHGYRNMRFENNLLYDSRSPSTWCLTTIPSQDDIMTAEQRLIISTTYSNLTVTQPMLILARSK
jgi:hypothetical protein